MLNPSEKLKETRQAIRVLKDAGYPVPPEAFEIEQLAEMAADLHEVKKILDAMDEFGRVYDPECELMPQAQRVFDLCCQLVDKTEHVELLRQ